MRWQGTPWRHQGRTRQGIDCGGMVMVCGWELGVFPRTLDVQNYPRYPDGTLKEKLTSIGMTLHREYAPGDVCDSAAVAAGTVLLMAPENPSLPCHLGIWTGDLLVHASVTRRRVVAHALRMQFARQVYAEYRYPGVRYG